MADTNKERLINTFAEYIREGVKKPGRKCLGVEVEHFVLYNESLRSVPYSGDCGVKGSVEKLMKLYPGAAPIKGEDLLGFITDDFCVTLEPAAQLEISIKQNEDIKEIGNIYKSFYKNLTEILKRQGQQPCTVGCQPVSLVDDLELIPKGRYRLMDKHFEKTGTGGRQMMRGTASTQVSVDYTSEDDFRRKLQAAYFYTPLIKLLSDRVETFQNEKVDVRLKRTDIWNRTDPARCGVLPGVFKADYGFRDYAGYLCTIPLIFVPEAGGERYTEFATASEIFEDRELTKSDIEHVLSMPFPDVRVKKYLEIRGADAMPLEGVLSICALVKGLLYSEDVLDRVQESIRDKGLREKDITNSEKDLMENGWKAKIYGIPAKEFLLDTLGQCEAGLSEEEYEYLHGWGGAIKEGR